MEDEIEYQVPADPDVTEAAQLYVEARWMKEPDEDLVRKMFSGTFAVSAAYCNGKLIGFMRALSDGVSDAYLLDLIVTERFRKHGVGGCIVKNLTAYLESCGVDWCCCIGVPGTEGFYSRNGGEVMKDYVPMRFGSSAN